MTVTATTPAEYLTVAETARLLKLSQTTVRRLIRRGELPAYRITDVGLRTCRTEVHEWLISRRATGPVDVRDGRRKGKRVGPKAHEEDG